MKNNNIGNYKLNASIHTIQIKTFSDVKIPDQIDCCVNQIFTGRTGAKKIILNLNKFQGDIFSFQEYKAIFERVTAAMEIESYRLMRADLRLDNYDSDFYATYQKLHRYLISMIAMTYAVRNLYKTDGIFSMKQISIAAKNQDFEIEHYDRQVKNHITGNQIEQAKSRLEERAIYHNSKKDWQIEDIEDLFCRRWFQRWDKAVKCRDDVEERYNQELIRIYTENKTAYPMQFSNINEFLRKYQEVIFTKKQLVSLLASIDDKNPENKARNFKSRYGCEFFSCDDVHAAVDEIKAATEKFF